MHNRKKRLDIYLTLLAIFVCATAALRSIAAATQLDFIYGHYADDTLISIADWLTFGGCVVLLSYVAIAPRGAKYHAIFTNEKTYISSALVSASLIFLGVMLIKNTISSLYPFHVDKLKNVTVVMPLAAAVLAILSVYYFFLNTYIKECTSTRRASASFIAILFMCIYPAYLYFSTALAINAPNKVIDQMAYLFCALFFLYEARLSLGRDKWGVYVAFGMTAALLTAYSAIPALAVYFVKGEVISDSLAETALTLSLFIFISSRLLLTRSLAPDEPIDVVMKITERTAARRAEIGESDIIPEQSGEQMEFDMSLFESETDEIPEDKDETQVQDTDSELDTVENYESAEELWDLEQSEEPTLTHDSDNTEMQE